MHLEISYAQSSPFCLGISVSKIASHEYIVNTSNNTLKHLYKNTFTLLKTPGVKNVSRGSKVLNMRVKGYSKSPLIYNFIKDFGYLNNLLYFI